MSSEEQQPLEEFFKSKNIRFKNEMADEVGLFPAEARTDSDCKPQAGGLIAAALDNDEVSSDEEGGRPDRGSADEDEESVDEDFRADSDSDVAEEFDSEHESSGAGSGSDAEMEDADEAVDESEGQRPKKKTKVGK